VLQVVGAFLLSSLDFVALLVIFHHLPHFAGWSLGEMSFLYGSSYMTFKLADILMTNLDRLPLLIRLGTFDQILTRPLGTLGQVLTGDLDIRHIGAIGQGGVVFAFALGRISIDWTPVRAVVFASMLLSAAVMFSGIYVATNAIAFWTMDAREVANSFTYGGQYLTQFPMNVFGVWFRRIFAYAVPLAFVNYFPSLYLLSKRDSIGAPGLLRFLSPLVAIAIVVVAAGVWRRAIGRYRSSGS
jgi:ABC-2 type transport system permease protein